MTIIKKNENVWKNNLRTSDGCSKRLQGSSQKGSDCKQRLQPMLGWGRMQPSRSRQWIMNPPSVGSIPIVHPSINRPFALETQDQPRKQFSCKSSRCFQTHPSNWYPLERQKAQNRIAYLLKAKTEWPIARVLCYPPIGLYRAAGRSESSESVFKMQLRTSPIV